MSVRPELTGARLSSLVRCVARAEHEALGTHRDEEATIFLDDAFVRGVNVAKAWVRDQKALTAAAGKTLIEEMEVPWGPPEYGWIGHADAVILEDKLVIEAYHAKGGTFRRHKALQAVGYAMQLGPDYRAMLAVLDSTDIDEDEGFAVTLIPLDVDELKTEVLLLMSLAAAAVAKGEWNPDDRVADNPADSECRHCPFRAPCWAEWEPPVPDYAPELDDTAALLVSLQGDRARLKQQLDQVDERVRIVRDELRPHTRLGVPLIAGGASIKRVATAPRRTFRFAAYEGAGHIVTPTMRDFLSEAADTGERWYIGKAP